MKKVILTLLIVFTCLDASSQSRIVKDFEAACDSLNWRERPHNLEGGHEKRISP